MAAKLQIIYEKNACIHKLFLIFANETQNNSS